MEESNAEQSNWQLRERESKEVIPLSFFPKLPCFPFLGLCVTRKQKNVVNWRVGGAQSTVHMRMAHVNWHGT